MGSSTASPAPPAMTVGIPAAAAIRAASTLLSMPPRPRCDASPNAASSVAAPSETSSAPGVPGLRVKTPSTSVRSTSSRARTRIATWAASVSLSPKVISSVAVTSFSLTTGTAPASNKRLQRMSCIDVRSTVGDVAGCEQYLSREQPLSFEGAFPCAVESRLAERRRRLQLRHRAWTPVEPEVREPECDGAGRDDRHRFAAAHDVRDLAGAPADDRSPDRAARSGDEARPELDDDRHRRCVPSPTTRYWRSQRSRYVTGPRGPGAQSTLMPVSGAPVNSKPSV